MDTFGTRLGRLGIVVLGTGIVAAIAWLLFVFGAAGNLARLIGILLVVLVAFAGARFAGTVAERYFATYNVAEVAVEGPIRRQGGRRVPTRPSATSADDVVEQIERATADDNVEGLLVRLNTPGGEVVPSEDIRNAVIDFDGPTVAYATDTCASGGYWIASGCDTIVAREGSIVGSIGVRASRVTAAALFDQLGLAYERLVAGEYKDAGVAFRDMDADERAYLQGIVDSYYDTFVERVTEGRDLDPEAVRETEARVFLGEEARDRGLVDTVGTKDDVESYLEDELAGPIAIREFEPSRRLPIIVSDAAARMAYSFGAGLREAVVEPTGEGETRFHVR